MKKLNVIAGTNNFGLGPVGKLSAIVTNTTNDCDWFACGNEFDLKIFGKDVFKDRLFSKDEKAVKEFIEKHKITHAVVVLDVELTKILLKNKVKVIFIDSLPFMWTQADIDQGLLPLDSTVYCAQKCVVLTEDAKKVLNKIENLVWINPIQANIKSNYRPFYNDYILINVGGLHSPIGNGESYIYTVIKPIIELLNDKNIVITCGSTANKIIRKILQENNLLRENIKIETLKQDDFLATVANSKIFITSPGLTTIYETSTLMKETIFLPPQNLSQFYNVEFAKKIINRYKVIDWETKKLNFEYLSKILDKGETYVVERIYEYITELVNGNYPVEFKERFFKLLTEEYQEKEESDFKIDGNGIYDIIKILREYRSNYE